MKSIILYLTLTLMTCCSSIFALAQQANVDPGIETPNPNSFWNTELMQPLALAMLAIIILLFLVLLSMSRVIHIFGEKVRQKLRAIKLTEHKSTLLLLFFAIIPIFTQAQTPAAETPAKLIGGLSTTSFYLLLTIIIIEIIAVLVLVRLFRIQLQIEDTTEKSLPIKQKKRKSWFERLNKTKSVEGVMEEDVSTGHSYDGIGELDNPTPPWWNWAFIISIIFAVIYLYRYHIAESAPLQLEELAIATEKAEKEVNAYLATSTDNVDENTVTLTTDANDINEGKTIYEEKCGSCHLVDGGGSIGPNLTDASWIHGCSINDIFKTIKYGVPEKGMISWKDQLSPKQIAQVANYVHSLKGSNPATPKDAEGVECIDNSASTSDTTATANVTDTTKI